MNHPGIHEVGSKVDRSKAAANRPRPKKFQPFYESAIARLPGPPLLVWKVGISVALGILFLIVFSKTAYGGVFSDSVWLLSLMITTSMLALYYATDTLRRLFPHMDGRLHERGKPFSRTKQTYYRTVRTRLSNRNFLLSGICFGTLNCFMGAWFGVPPAYSGAGRLAVFCSFFVVGFICGMAALGIYGIIETIKNFIRAPQLELDYSSPDGCGGMRFLGEALIKFGSVTLVMGVLIAIFIVNFPWSKHERWWVRGLMWFWIAWPFALSLIVVLAPSAEISGVLGDYKVECQDDLDERLINLRTRANDSNVEPSDRDAARKDYDYYSKQREAVYNMSTWPYGLGSSVKYVGIFIANAGTLFMAGAKTMVENLVKH
jgi:hypothetical protein